MLIVNNAANFANMPAFGGINIANDLVFGLRANAVTNTVNLSDKANKAVITANTAKYADTGVVGNTTDYLQTSFAPDSADLTIKLVCKFKGLATDKGVLVGVAGDIDGNAGIGVLMSSVPNAANYDYEMRFYVAANNATKVRMVSYKFITNAKITETAQINVWCKIDNAAKKLFIKVDNAPWQEIYFSDADYTNRSDSGWQIGKVPKFATATGASVVISEVLVWDKILTSAEIDQQNKLSQRWLSTLA